MDANKLKSFIAIKIIEKLAKKTVILVDEIFLAQQWCIYFKKNTDIAEEKILILHGKTKKADWARIETADIIIASKDSLSKKEDVIEKLKYNCGVLCIDEIHTLAAKVFTDVVKEFDAKWVLGLTATAERDDGLSFLVNALAGEIVVQAGIQESVSLGSSILPLLRPIYLKKTYEHEITKKMHYAEAAKIAMLDPGAITALAHIITQHYQNKDIQLVITQRIEESHYLKKCLVKLGIPEAEIGLVLGVTDLKEREQIVNAVETGEVKVIISSTVFDKGVSVNRINVLHNYFPSKEVANTIQRCGRISRTAEGKTYAIIYDYIFDYVE